MFCKQSTLIILFFGIFLCISAGCSQKICKVAPETKGSYTIRGKTYRPLKSVSHAFNQKGTASWYGPGFHGRKTASGEVYNMHALTAAHCTLPLDTLLKVTNLRNNREVIVRVNDRGPFVGDRMLDLSKAAADHLGMVKDGIAPVRIAVLPGGKPRHSTKKLAKAKAKTKAKIMAPNPFFGRATRLRRLAKKI
jgi:peptidoglycan lytic transglycosylase